MATREYLVDAPGLMSELGDSRLRVIDATAFLRREVAGGPYEVEGGRLNFDEAHIPGAVFADIPGELSEPASRFNFTVPGPERFAVAMGALGVGPSTRVVAYSSDAPMWACRIWWLLRYFGFDDVRVLDGGLASWRKAGYPLSTETAATAPAPFVAKVRPELLATKDDILAVLAGRGTCLVNALSPETFRGEVNPYFRPGRIPGSLNVPAHNLIDQHTGCFRPAFELAAELGDLAHAGQPTPAIVYCGGGISATVDIFALAILGRDDVRLYDGSLNEWSADPRLALEVG